MNIFSRKKEEKKPRSQTITNALTHDISQAGTQGSIRTLLSSHITEKATRMQERGTYFFKVLLSANKRDIKKAVEKMYGVHVRAVSVLNVRGKRLRVGRHEGKSPHWRKAMVTLKEGETITI